MSWFGVISRREASSATGESPARPSAGPVLSLKDPVAQPTACETAVQRCKSVVTTLKKEHPENLLTNQFGFWVIFFLRDLKRELQGVSGKRSFNQVLSFRWLLVHHYLLISKLKFLFSIHPCLPEMLDISHHKVLMTSLLLILSPCSPLEIR